MALGLCFTVLSSNLCYAATTADTVIAEAVNDGILLPELDDETTSFLSKLSTVFDEFSLNDTGVLILNSSMDTIQKKAGFSDSEMIMFENLLQFNKSHPAGQEDIPMTRIQVEGWKIKFTQADVQTFLAGAAAVGPAAIIAALSGLGSVVPGIGNVLGGILGVVSAVDLCVLVSRAILQNKGIYIGIEWNGPIPHYTQGLW